MTCSLPAVSTLTKGSAAVVLVPVSHKVICFLSVFSFAKEEKKSQLTATSLK